MLGKGKSGMGGKNKVVGSGSGPQATRPAIRLIRSGAVIGGVNSKNSKIEIVRLDLGTSSYFLILLEGGLTLT